MKKSILFTIVTLFIIAGCTQQPEVKVTDIDTNRKNITKIADSYLNAWNTKNKDAIANLLADDGMYFGTDPSEILDNEGLLDMCTQLFSDTTTNYSYDVISRKIKLATDGNSALIIEYIDMDGWTPILKMRQTYQIVKTPSDWKIDFIEWGFIAKNEEVEELGKALQK